MTDEEAQEHSGIEEIKRESLRLEALKHEKAEIEQEIADIEKYLDKAVESSVTFDDEDHEEAVFVTVVRGTVSRFDEFLISSKFPIIWQSVTKRVMDPEKYKALVRSGDISPAMHKAFHHESPKKPYVKITRRKMYAKETNE